MNGRFVFYSHDGVGLGHLRRNLAIAAALTEAAPDASVLLATGCDDLGAHGLAPNVDVLVLPGLRKVANGRYSARRLPMSGKEVRALRAAQLETAIRSFQPDVMLIDKHPVGVRGELRPALDALLAIGGRAALGLRDILDDSASVAEEWAQTGVIEAMERYIDRVLVYGDPRVLAVVEEYGLPEALAARSRYCGYVVNPEPARAAAVEALPDFATRLDRRPTVLATAGGGEDGWSLLESFVLAAEEAAWDAVVVCGPQLSARRRHALRALSMQSNVEFHVNEPDVAAWLSHVDALVCMGGYNTLCEATSRGTPTLCVPRVEPRREQLIRARAFARLGLLRVVEPTRLTPDLLRREVAALLGASRRELSERARGTLGFAGAAAAAAELLDLAQTAAPRASSHRSRPQPDRAAGPMSARRIGYVLKRFPRLSETFVAAELIELERQGEQLAVFAVSDPGEPVRHAFVDELRAPVVYLPHRPWREPLRVARSLARVLRSDARGWLRAARYSLWPPRSRGLRRLLQATVLRDEMRSAGIDHAHAHFATAAARLANLAWRMGGPEYSVTAHAKDIYHEEVRVDHLRDKLASARFVAAVSGAGRDHLDALLGLDGRLAVVPNSVDLRRLGPARTGPGRPGLVLTVARLVEKKGLRDLVEACALLEREAIALQLEVVGGGPLRGELRAAAERLGVNARFLGPLPQEHVLARYRQASVYCLPCVVAESGDRDGLPTSVLEAMALGVPVVTTAVSGLPEAVIDGETGLLVPQHDPEALAAAIRRLLTDGELAARLAARARSHVEERFALERSAARLRALFGGAA